LDPNDNKKLESIPSIYFTPYFDLTDPNTFTDLLLLDIDPKQKYENMSSFLYTVEIRLLHQVRYKLERFFEETDNFTQLKIDPRMFRGCSDIT
jgi:hypothetical protein